MEPGVAVPTPGDHDMCLGSPEFNIECFGLEIGECDAGVGGEGVVGHVEGDLGQNVEARLRLRGSLLTLMISYEWTVS